MANCTKKFYTYAIFISWVVVFFAILAIFYSFMETGVLIPPARPPPPDHVFAWMKQAATTEESLEPITDMTYRDNKKLEQNIANLGDPVYQIALNALHMEELKLQNGQPYPNSHYYLEPFSGSKENAVAGDAAASPFTGEFSFSQNLEDNPIQFGYGSGARFMESFYARRTRNNQKPPVENSKEDTTATVTS